MSRDINYSILLDFYNKLLTKKQAEALELYYNMDYSLAEIAEIMNVTRQGVRAFITSGREHLCTLEEKLGVAARFARIEAATRGLMSLVPEVRDTCVAAKMNKYIEDISKANDMEL